MKTVKCQGCGLPLTSALTEDEILAAVQEQDPTVKTVTILCHCCMALEEAANPDGTIYRPDDDSPHEV